MEAETKTRTPKGRKWGRIILCTLFLLVSVTAFLFLRYVTNMLSTEQAAARFGAGAGRFAQITAFLPEHDGLSPGAVDEIPFALRSAMLDQGLDVSQTENAFAYAYSASAQVLQVSSRDRGPVEVFATGVGGNFFLFQSVHLISGSFLPPDSVNRDMVLIDEALAWDLFQATNVAGLEMYIRDTPFLIVGVYRPRADFASETAYGDRAHLFFYLDAFGDFGMNPITMVQAVLPNPLTGLAEEMFREGMDDLNVDEDAFVLVNNTDRYRVPALWRVIRSFGARSMVQTGLRLPYWENAARMAEDFAALAFLLLMLSLLYPVFCAIRLLVRKWRRRKWRFFRSAWGKVDSKREEKKEKNWREREAAHDDVEPDEQYDLEEIIRSVRESEDYHDETKM